MDTNQTDKDLAEILRQLAPWGIKKTNVHTGTSKRVYVKDTTDIKPRGAKAYLTSRFQTMENPRTLEKEHKYTRYLDTRFPGLLVSESPINSDNEPLTTILNSKRGLLITKKNIARTPKPTNGPPSDTESLLKFMMDSTDFLIENGIANLDLKPQNIGLIVDSRNELRHELRINDNGANMFYPIPSKYREHYRDAIKLVALFTLSSFGFGLDKTMFDANRELYPTINYQRALELRLEFKEEEEDEIREYAKEKMSKVRVDGKDEDLSSLFDDILFPDQLVRWYGGQYKPDVFIAKLRKMGLISHEEREQNEAERHAEAERQELLERERHAEAERQELLERERHAEAERQERFQRIEDEAELKRKQEIKRFYKNKNNTIRKERNRNRKSNGSSGSRGSQSNGSRSRRSRSRRSRSTGEMRTSL
jgi:hypothetical protein